MKPVLQPIQSFLGLVTQVDSSQVPLGGALKLSNLAMLSAGRLRRIPGITATGTAASDAITQIPLLMRAKSIGGTDYTFGVLEGADTYLVNMTTADVLTGPAFAATSFGEPWSTTWYNQYYMIAGGGNTIRQIDSATAQSEVTGTLIPAGNLIQSFQDRLYVADIAGEPEGIVYYSDILTTDFAALDVLNVTEIPGKVTALGINSPSTQSMGISTELLIFKSGAFWSWYIDSSGNYYKVLVSSAVGTLSPHSIVNTEAGTIFLGHKEGIYSVYLLAVGSVGEPLDIGPFLYDIFNKTTKIAHPELAYAVRHGHFYKLFFCTGTDTTNASEVWLDVDQLTASQTPVWYGVHSRGGVDAAVNTGSGLELARRSALGGNVIFTENADPDSGFTDMDGSALSAVLDLPINVDPQGWEKQFALMELYLAPEANTSGNQILCEVFADNQSLGSTLIDLYDATTSGVVKAQIPLRAAGRTGMMTSNARVKLTHSLNARLDILGGLIHYLTYEEYQRVSK